MKPEEEGAGLETGGSLNKYSRQGVTYKDSRYLKLD